jgi:3-hydroxyisobutyrate dehydrogenase-like beta-hydroxyacid dehydrogenase
MGDISFLGLGDMGFAIANTAMKAGYDTVVWNRTKERAAPLLEDGAILASSPVEAVSKSPVIIVCVSDYKVAETFLQTPDALAALNGRVLVQLSTGSPKQARATEDWVHQAGASYLDGEILAYVEQIGTSESLFLVSGDDEAFSQSEELLKILAPQTRYLGPNPARASALTLGFHSGSLGLIAGILNGAAICEAEGVSMSEFGDLIPLLMGYDAKALSESVKRIEAGGLEDSDASIGVWAAITKPMIETANENGYDPVFPAFIQSLFNRAIKNGHGEHDVGALINVLRPDSR